LLSKFIKNTFTFFIIGIITISGQNKSYKFNFGTQNGSNYNDFIHIDAKTLYSPKNKCGLLSEGVVNNKIEKKWAKITPEIATGIKSSTVIKFKAVIEPGEYYLEINLDGGNTGHWQGKISVNDSVIIDEMYSFTSDPESDEAPNYWSVIEKVKVNSKEFLLSVKAKNQESSLSSLALIPVKNGKLKLIDGKIIADKSFFAPNSKLIIDLINKGIIKETMRYIDAIPEVMFGREKAELLLATAGRLETEEPVQLISNALRILQNEKGKNNSANIDLDIRTAELYIYADQSYQSGGWDWTKKLTQTGIFDHINSSGMAYQEIVQFEDHPLQIRAMYELAKVSFWIWVEQGRQRELNIADRYFKIVQKYYPYNIGIKDAHDIDVTIVEINGSGLNEIEIKTIKKIKAPLDLQPKIKVVEFLISNKSSKYEIRINERSNIEEITTLNNKISFTTNSN